MPVDLKLQASRGFVFVYFLYSDHCNSDMQGRACRDDSVVIYDWISGRTTGITTSGHVVVVDVSARPVRHESDSDVRWWSCALAILLGLLSDLLIGFVAEYYTPNSYILVREIAETQPQPRATGITCGLALGYASTIIPVQGLVLTVLVAQVRHLRCGVGCIGHAW